MATPTSVKDRSDRPPDSVNDLVLVTEDEHVATVTLNRPAQYNVMCRQTLARLSECFAYLHGAAHIRVVILAAHGKAFCAGHDLKEMRANPSRDFQQALFTQCSQMMLAMIRLPQPVIARVHGPAVAAGCQLVANADLAIASTDARFAVSGINLGLFCGTPSVPLARNVPQKRALQMLFLGETIDARTAHDYSLVNSVVEPDALDTTIAEWAATVCSKPPATVALGKALYYRQIDRPLQDAYHAATDMMADNMMLADTQEGVDAFIEKRPPKWDS